MISLTPYLLIKLNEKCIDLASELFKFQCYKNTKETQELNDACISKVYENIINEYNDVLAICEMVSILENFSNTFNKVEHANDLLIVQSMSLTLDLAKISNKCLVFGTNELYDNEKTTNSKKLENAINSLKDTISKLEHKGDKLYSFVCKKAQAKKLKEILQYIDISIKEGTK